MSWTRLTLAASLFILAVAMVPARADDELSQFVQRSKLAAQKLTNDVNHSLAQAKVLERGEPEKGRALLERVLEHVRNSQDLPEADRTRMSQQLQARIRQLSEASRVRRAADAETAQRVLEQTRPRPNPAAGQDPTALAQGFINTGKAQLGATRGIRTERDRGFNGVMSSVDNSAVAIAGDVAFAKNWKQLSELRKQTVGPQLTAKEVALIRTLNSTLSVDFNGVSFKDVINYLQDKTGLAIIVDEGSLREAMVDYEDDKVNFKVNKVAVRTILRKILADRGLAYVLKEGTVQIVTTQKARETMVVRTYPISDLINPGPYGQMFGPFVAQVQMWSNAQTLINLIQNTIDPPMWNVNGGPASVAFIPQTMALVVRGSAEMHYSLAGQLGP
jgi:hypothetical protein